MAANIFKIEGSPKKVLSYQEFRNSEKNNEFNGILFFSEIFNETPKKVIVIKEKRIVNVSFKDTHFENVRFIDVCFEKCLLFGADFQNCEFINCTFVETNTLKANFTDTLIDPDYFKDNFDLISDTNIAADLYHSLYKNLSDERQPGRAKESLYLMYRAEYAHLISQLNRKKITKKKYLKKRAWHIFNNLTSGYGLKLYRVLLTLIMVVFLFSTVNYLFRDAFFEVGKINTFLDSVYFTLVTLTTLGYGDVTPFTQWGKAIITFQTGMGIVIISLFLSSITSKVVRS